MPDKLEEQVKKGKTRVRESHNCNNNNVGKGKGRTATTAAVQKRKKKERARRQRKRRAQRQQTNNFISQIIDILVSRACNQGKPLDGEADRWREMVALHRKHASKNGNAHVKDNGDVDRKYEKHSKDAPAFNAGSNQFIYQQYYAHPGGLNSRTFTPATRLDDQQLNIHAYLPTTGVVDVREHLVGVHFPANPQQHRQHKVLQQQQHQLHQRVPFGFQVERHYQLPQGQIRQQQTADGSYWSHANSLSTDTGNMHRQEMSKKDMQQVEFEHIKSDQHNSVTNSGAKMHAMAPPRGEVGTGKTQWRSGVGTMTGQECDTMHQNHLISNGDYQEMNLIQTSENSLDAIKTAGTSKSQHFDVSAHDPCNWYEEVEEQHIELSDSDLWLFDDSKPIQLVMDPRSSGDEEEQQFNDSANSKRTNDVKLKSNVGKINGLHLEHNRHLPQHKLPNVANSVDASAQTSQNSNVSTTGKSESMMMGDSSTHDLSWRSAIANNACVTKSRHHGLVPQLNLSALRTEGTSYRHIENKRMQKEPPILHQLTMHFLKPWECGAVAAVCTAWRRWLKHGFLYKYDFQPSTGSRGHGDPLDSPLHPPPPAAWGVAPERHWMLHGQILDMAHSFTKIARTRRPWQLAVVNATRVAILQLWPGARVEIFGSFAHGLAGPGSDVDLVVCDVLAHYEWVMQGGTSKVRERPRESCAEQLGRHLQGLDWVQTVTVIQSAEVPVIKVSTAFEETGSGGISLDISFDGPNHRGIVTCALVAQLQACYPSLKPLVLVLKHLLITKGLNQTYLGGISSYGIVLMVTAMLQLWNQHFHHIPKNLGTLLIFFLYLYGVLFHPTHYGIAILLTRDAMDPASIPNSSNSTSNTHLKHRLLGNSTTTTTSTGITTVRSDTYMSAKTEQSSNNENRSPEINRNGVLTAPPPAFSMLGPIYLRHTSRHRIALQRFWQQHAPHLLIPPRKAGIQGLQVVRDVDVLEHIRRVVKSYSQRQPGAIYLDLRKRFGIDPGDELLMPDERIFIHEKWSVDPLEMMDPFDHRNNLGKNCFGILPLGAELAAALHRVQTVRLFEGSTVLGAVFAAQEGGDHRQLIRLQRLLWSAPTKNGTSTGSSSGHGSVVDILDTPSTLLDNSTEYRRSPLPNRQGAATSESKARSDADSKKERLHGTEHRIEDAEVAVNKNSDSTHHAKVTASDKNISFSSKATLTKQIAGTVPTSALVALPSISEGNVHVRNTGRDASNPTRGIASVGPHDKNHSTSVKILVKEQQLPHAVPAAVTPSLSDEASAVATRAKMLLEAMLSRSLQVSAGVRQVFSTSIASSSTSTSGKAAGAIANDNSVSVSSHTSLTSVNASTTSVRTSSVVASPSGARMEWWDMDWLARYMVHTHCSHTAIQPLLLDITFEFDRFSAQMGLMPRRKRWSQLVLKKSVEFALTLLGSTSILIDDQTKHDLKACGRWLGLLTLARNQPLLHADLDLKSLLEGSRVEDLVVIVPFVTNFLMSAADSIVFRPPNPWTMALVELLRQIYDSDLPSVKLATKFEIVVLFEHIGITISGDQQRRLSTSSTGSTGSSLHTNPNKDNSMQYDGSSNKSVAIHAKQRTVPDGDHDPHHINESANLKSLPHSTTISDNTRLQSSQFEPSPSIVKRVDATQFTSPNTDLIDEPALKINFTTMEALKHAGASTERPSSSHASMNSSDDNWAAHKVKWAENAFNFLQSLETRVSSEIVTNSAKHDGSRSSTGYALGENITSDELENLRKLLASWQPK